MNRQYFCPTAPGGLGEVSLADKVTMQANQDLLGQPKGVCLTRTYASRGARANARAAFTLIELLTVIVIIGILAAILIPAASRVRQSARDIQCTANIRQYGVAIHLYTEDHNGIFPDTAGSSAHSNLVEYLNLKIKNATLKIHFIDCPVSYDKNGTPTHWSYGFNTNISEQPKSSVARPSRLILATCSSSQWIRETDYKTVPKPHSGKVSVLRFTGSVVRQKVSTICYSDLRIDPTPEDDATYILKGNTQYDK